MLDLECILCNNIRALIEVWLSLVERFVRDEEAAGSNPVTSTNGTGFLTRP